MVDVGRGIMRHLMEASGETVNSHRERRLRRFRYPRLKAHQSIRAFTAPVRAGRCMRQALAKR